MAHESNKKVEPGARKSKESGRMKNVGLIKILHGDISPPYGVGELLQVNPRGMDIAVLHNLKRVFPIILGLSNPR